jgi:signal transduction histidine kinase
MMEKEASAIQPVRVLLIEDNLGFAYFVRDVLLRLHPDQFDLREARTLAEGLQFLETAPTDVILLDLGLPDSSRMDTFAIVHSRAPRMPVIVLTVLDDDDIALAAMRQGAQDYLVKGTLDSQLLVKTIRYARERSRADDAVYDLSARLIELQDEERRRIARDLHDSTAQTLSALLMTLSQFNHWMPRLPAEAHAVLKQCDTLARRGFDELRTTAYLLHPPLLDELGLCGAVREYCDGFAERSRIRVDLELPDPMPPVSKDIETTLFRVMQECLANIHRHSGSKTASIRFGHVPNAIRLEVRDEGKGIPTPATPMGPMPAGTRPGVGIAGMRERIRQMKGQFDIHSTPSGTTIQATVPLRGGRP